MVATHIFHKLVNSARPLNEEGIMGLFVSVFDSSGELAGPPEFSGSCARVCSGAEVEVGRSSGEDGHGATIMLPWISSQLCIILRVCSGGRFSQSHLCSVFRSSRSPRS